MKKVNFTAFDFETATYDRMPCQLGLVVVREGKIVEEKKFLIKPPGNKYDSGCTKVHGITDKDTERCFEFNVLWTEIKPYFDCEVLVAHNLSFDSDVLYKVMNYYNLPDFINLASRCTQKIYCDRSLDDVLIALNIPMKNHHNALSDARYCALIFIEYMKGINPDELPYPTKKKASTFKNSLDANRQISHAATIQDLSTVKNTNTIFYDRTVVISGIFENFPLRNDLALFFKEHGAKVNSSISSKTDLFIIGSDYGPKKMEEVEQLQKEGYDIKILNEDDLMNELINIYAKERIR